MDTLTDSDKKEDLLTQTKTILNSLVIPHPRGVSLRTLCKDYDEIEGMATDDHPIATDHSFRLLF